MIKIRLTFLTVLLFNFSEIAAQSDTTHNLKQVISYHENGNIKIIENFLSDSCRLFSSTFQDYIQVDTCRDGYFKEYYPKGILKTLGQYDCEFINPSFREDDCFKSGIWYEFDSLGEVSVITRYDVGKPIFYKYPLKRDTLTIKEDSIWVKLDAYHTTNSYLIRRGNYHHGLFLEFPVISSHNYRLVFSKQFNLLIEDIDDYSNFLFRFKEDDLPTKNQRYLDASQLKNGKYYVYYKSLGLTNIYEIEIILEDSD